MLDLRLLLVISLVISLVWADPSPGDSNINMNPWDMKKDAKMPPPAELAHQNYLGCFSDTSSRILPVLAYANQQNSIEKCKAACKAKDFLFAGVQFRCLEPER